jgi:ectoine hydroxylase-related dioxygenase (phytanoyl-CoA dioxygenase family)
MQLHDVKTTEANVGTTMFSPRRRSRWQLGADDYWFFRHSGFLRLRTRVAEADVERMRQVVERDVLSALPPYRRNEAGEIKRLDRLIDRDPVFLEMLRAPEVAHPLQSLLGPNVFVLRNRHNHATMNRRGDIPFRLHRDVLQWSRPILTTIVYLEDATIENGCTHVVPGSHLAAFVEMPPDGGGGNWADDHPEYEALHAQALPVPMPAGGILVFESLLFHSVGVNSTDGSRMSVTFGFHSVDEIDDSIQEKRLLLCGDRIYRGNDLLHK